MRRPTGSDWITIFILASILGAIVGPVFLVWVAWLDHLRRYHSEAEFWGIYYILPGALFGATFAGGLVLWTRRLVESHHWPLDKPWLWYALVPVLFCAALVVLLVVATLLGTWASPEWWFAALVAIWLPLLWFIVRSGGRK